MNSAEYWAKREAEQLKHNITDEIEYDKQIKRIYSDMLDKAQREINAFYGKYAAKEGITLAEAKKRVKTLDIEEYERKAARYVRDKDFSAKANEEMRLYNATMKINRLEMLKANIGLELIAGHDELNKFMGGILQGRTEDELKRQAGILGKTIQNNAKTANAIVNASFHNATFSDRIWLYQDIMKADLAKLLQSGLIAGKNPRQLASELKNKFDTSTFNAERLMRTELARVQTEAQKQSFERNGFKEYEFIVNGGCCPICEALKGKHFKVDKMSVGENAPPMHPHCRCSTAAYEDSEDYNAWLNYLDKGGTTAEWEKQKAAIAQEASLRTKSGGDFGVNWKRVKGKDYTERFNQLSDNPKANSLAAQRSRNALVNRNGKNTEELYAISLTTGKDVSAITNQNIAFGVNRTEKFMNDVSRAESNGEKVLFIHNHPKSRTPSIVDLNELLNHENAVGITVGHNGNIYYYTKPSKEITNFDLSVAIRKNIMYNGTRRAEKALETLAKDFGFEFYIL